MAAMRRSRNQGGEAPARWLPGSPRPGERSGLSLRVPGYRRPSEERPLNQAMARRKSRRSASRSSRGSRRRSGNASATEAEVFTRLWDDPKYVRLQTRKDAALKALSYAEAHYRQPDGRERLERAIRLAHGAIKRMQDYEGKAFDAAGYRDRGLTAPFSEMRTRILSRLGLPPR